MNQEYNIQSARVIRFRRWSNTSFAVFNSLGRVIQIGFLSKIIHGVTATSTDSHSIKIEKQSDRNDESTGAGWLELEALKLLELLGVMPTIDLVSDTSSSAGRLSVSDFQTHIHLRPFWGLLFYIGVASIGISGLFILHLNDHA